MSMSCFTKYLISSTLREELWLFKKSCLCLPISKVFMIALCQGEITIGGGGWLACNVLIVILTLHQKSACSFDPSFNLKSWRRLKHLHIYSQHILISSSEIKVLLSKLNEFPGVSVLSAINSYKSPSSCFKLVIFLKFTLLSKIFLLHNGSCVYC